MKGGYIFGILSSVRLDIYPGEGLRDHLAIWCFIFWEISTSLFFRALLLYIPSVQAVCSAHHQQIFFLIWAVSAGVRRYLIVLLICISINISDFEHFDVPVRAENIRSVPLTVLKSDLLFALAPYLLMFLIYFEY